MILQRTTVSTRSYSSACTADLTPISAPVSLLRWLRTLDPDILEIIHTIGSYKSEGDHHAWVVGGAVRDALLGIAPSDVDLVTTLLPEQLGDLFPRTIFTGAKYGVVTVRHGSAAVECSTLREKLGGPHDGRRIEDITFGNTLRKDLAIRDFTINAMALDTTDGVLYDPFGGLADAHAHIVRAVSNPPELMLRSDGLRVLRAYRFLGAAALQEPPWQLDSALSEALQNGAQYLQHITPERISMELKKILCGPRAPDIVQLMVKHNVLQAALPLPAPLQLDSRELCALHALWQEPGIVQAINNAQPVHVPDHFRPDPFEHPVRPAAPQPFSFYAVIDFEATCWAKGQTPKDAVAEVIELPVVLIDSINGCVLCEFHTFVQPTLNSTLSDFCKNLTGISQRDVDAAPAFKDAIAKMLLWLTGVTAGASLAFISDGPWDLMTMLPRQWHLSHGDGAELPPVFQHCIDMREVFKEVYPRQSQGQLKTLHSLCRAIALEPVDRAHSGLADARNTARVVLAILEDGGVFMTDDMKKSAGQDHVTVTKDDMAMEALCILSGCCPAEAVPELCKRLKLTSSQQKRVCQHALFLGHVPDPDNHGEVRRYLTCFSDQSLVEAQYRLERSWAHFHRRADEQEFALQRIREVMRIASSQRSSAVCPPPLADGHWLREHSGIQGGLLLGRLKEWLYYLQVDKDLQTTEEILDMLRSIDWQDTDIQDMPFISWPPSAHMPPRCTPLARASFRKRSK